VDIELKYTLARILFANTVIVGLLVFVFFIKDTIRALLENRTFWKILTALIFILCIGGTAFNMIHKVPTFKYGQDQYGNTIVEEYFQRNQRSQYSGEGYMISTMMLSIGSLIIASFYLDKIKSTLYKEAV
jgi:ABC-type phosphate transport system permease subunit